MSYMVCGGGEGGGVFLGRKRVGRKRGGAGRTPPRGAVREGPGGE